MTHHQDRTATSYRAPVTPAVALFALFALVLVSLLGAPSLGQSGGANAADQDAAAQYLTAAADDPVARLQKRIDSGQTRLEWHERHGYLRAVLRELGIPASSQMLVFSKTSMQRDRISPGAPRAIYFNDQCYVGWVQGGDLEISAADPKLGGTFYTLRQQKVARPRLVRQTYDCLQCHSSPMTKDVPGHAVRSVFTRADGLPELSAGSFVTTDQSPLEERWGGWYVTGKHGDQRHMGNVPARGGRGDEVTLDKEAGANVTDLGRFLDTAPYLTRHSDIVALMVLEHQTNLHNLITKANYLTRDALRDERRMNALEGAPPEARRPSTVGRVKSAAEPLVEALLFSGEAKLSEPISGTSGFAKEFAAGGPRDKQGRSLRDLDLTRRLLRHPCSYLIYSDAFDALPAPAREYVYRRLGEVLGGAEQGKEFAHLSAADRRAILEILLETKPDFAAAYRKAVAD